MFRLAIVIMLGLLVAVGCASDGSAPDALEEGEPTSSEAGEDASAESSPDLDPEPEPEPDPLEGVNASVEVARFRAAEDSLGMGPDFDEIIITFTVVVQNGSERDIVAAEGVAYLVDPFGDRADGLGFEFLEPIPASDQRTNRDLGVSFERYQCDMGWKDWCRAFDADFVNFSVEAEVTRVVFEDGEVVTG